MGLIIDTNVLIRVERDGSAVDFSRWAGYGDAYISVITASELLVGEHRANTESRKLRRSAFVEGLLAAIPVLDFTLESARIHAEIAASLAAKGALMGAHDLIIGATALTHGYAVLTFDLTEFGRIPGLDIINPVD